MGVILAACLVEACLVKCMPYTKMEKSAKNVDFRNYGRFQKWRFGNRLLLIVSLQYKFKKIAMAKQCGTHSFTGKLGATIGYKLGNGVYIERESGSKEGKAFKKDPRRWRTMYNAGLFAQASKAVQFIYRALPKNQRQHGVYGKLSGKAFSMLRLGSSVDEVKAALMKQYVEDRQPLIVAGQGRAVDAGIPSGTSVSGACTVADMDCKRVTSLQYPIFPDHPQYIVQQKENNKPRMYTFIFRPDRQHT
jgi:hypothetical protein